VGHSSNRRIEPLQGSDLDAISRWSTNLCSRGTYGLVRRSVKPLQ